MARTVSAAALMNAPCPRAGVTISGLGAADSVITVWRIADGERAPVRGARRVVMNDGAYVIDYDAPLGRPITYEIEVISGPSGVGRFSADPVTIDTDSAWITDPLAPEAAVEVRRRITATGAPTFQVDALRDFAYSANVSVIEIMGARRGMALTGPRSAAKGVSISLRTEAADENNRVRDLFAQAGTVLVRVPKPVSDVIEGACFLAVETVTETSRKAHTGLDRSDWAISGDTVAAPAIRPLTSLYTYGHVTLLFDTYQQKQDAATGTYLADLKRPLGA